MNSDLLQNNFCLACHDQFNWWSTPPHYTPIMIQENELIAVSPLCEPCWEKLSVQDKRSAYLDLIALWDQTGFTCYYKTPRGIWKNAIAPIMMGFQYEISSIKKEIFEQLLREDMLGTLFVSSNSQ